MAKFIISGQQKLSGKIEVFGAKNAALIMVAACCLVEGESVLENIPDILDIAKIVSILEKLGVRFQRAGHQLKIDPRHLKEGKIDPVLVGAIRASIVLVGPLLARFAKVVIPHPGGCIIGSRPIDLHIRAFEDLGVKISQDNNFYTFEKNSQNLTHQTSVVNFEKISVTATENILMFASAQPNCKVIIKNAALEPEIIDLIEFLKRAGAKITVQNRTIKIFGQKNLRGTRHKVIPDRIEAGTFAIMAATTKNELKICQIIPEHLTALLEKFRLMGIKFVTGKDFLYIKKSPEMRAIDVETAEYPGFSTDLQPPMGVLLTQARGQSHIHENIFDHRLEYLHELQKMGAQIKLLGTRKAEITGPTPLTGAKIESLDLRAGATLLVAALTARGTTEINHAENIDRGYEKIEERLNSIGAKIKRVQ